MGTDTQRETCGRFAPSPSGRMHLGNVCSVLLSWLTARKTGAAYKLRLEDLDARCTDEYTRDIIDDLAWLGIDYDEVMMTQRGREDSYERACRKLEGMGLVYPCFCSRADLHAATAPHASDGTFIYAGTCRGLSDAERREKALVRPPAKRLSVRGARMSCFDEVLGDCSQDLERECGDFVICRSDGVFAYQLVCVIDDAFQGVSQVVRGRDLLGSVARQCYLIDLLGYERPKYYHHPLMVAPDGRRLSKRDRDCDLGILRERGGDAGKVIGLCAYGLGLAGLSDAVGGLLPADLVSAFSWDSVTREDVVVDADLLGLFGLL